MTYSRADFRDFFRAVKILQRNLALDEEDERRRQIGHDSHPDQELIRFRTRQGIGFPARTIDEVKPVYSDDEATKLKRYDLWITFFGLTGTLGVLPQHYSEMVMERERLRDDAIADFFDLFNHRLISLFYRAWEKYRLPGLYESSHRARQENDGYSQALKSLTGKSRPLLDHWRIFYGGFFANPVRNASSLKTMVSDYLRLPVEIDPFKGQWLYLADSDRSRLGGRLSLNGSHRQLAKDFMLGSRVWDMQSKFVILVRCPTVKRFNQLLPEQKEVEVLQQLISAYIGNGISFDIQVVLPRREVPACRLQRSPAYTARLGWNSWTKKRLEREVTRNATFHQHAY